MAKKTTIKCPYCGCEYLPCEIYYPNEFLGRSENVYKDENGEILGFSGTDMNTVETFYCDKCKKEFTVDASITFKTSAKVDIFDDDLEFNEINNKK